MGYAGRKPGAKDLVPRKQRPRVPTNELFWRHVDKSGGCWIWTGGKNDDGYGLMNVRLGVNKWAPRLAHRLSAQFAGMHIDGISVLHRCDNPPCVNPGHLFLGTREDNVADMDRKGRRGSLKGSAHGNSKLTDEQVIEIRRLRASGSRGIDLARRFGVSPSAIVWITKRKQWTHIDQPPPDPANPNGIFA